MKRIKSFLMALSILCASVALIQGCQTDVEHLDKAGKDVKFKASSENTVMTRTSYSGARFTSGGKEKERINWVIGDQIRIWSDKATDRYHSDRNYSDYDVTAVSDDRHKSKANIAPAEENGLVWATGTHKFYSVYPSPDVNGAVIYDDLDSDGCHLMTSIPANQGYTLASDGVTLNPDMNYAYMFAAVTTDYESTVDLHYNPMFNAFQFTVGSGYDDEMTIYNFTLENEAGGQKGPAGEFKVHITAKSDPDLSSASFTTAGVTTGQPDTLKAVNVKFNGDEGIVVRKGSPVKFVVFARPQEYTKMSITFTTSAGTKHLDLMDSDDNWVTFPACSKADIDLSLPGTINYVLTVDGSETGTTVSFDGPEVSAGSAQKDITVVSYRTLSSGINEKVPWKAQALASDGTTWVDYNDPEWPDWLVLSQYSGTGAFASDGEEVTVFAHPDPAIITPTEVGTAGAMAALTGQSEVGSESAPRDLSLYDIQGNLHPGPIVTSITKAGSHTANCYVVNAPGWYCFPIVYGNAIDQTRGNASGVNVSAYNKLVNSSNTLISSPYVLSDMGLGASECEAVVVWMDQLTGKGVIREDLEVISAPSGAGLSCDYIKFHIAQANILPGNALIALRSKSDDTILWSWHIWIDPVNDGLNVQPVKYRVDGSSDVLSSVQLLNSNLGWSAPMKFTVSQAGSSQIRFVQDYGTHAPVDNPVSYSNGEVYTGKFASGTYYQWGRKDPFLPSNGNSGNEVSNAATNRACYSPIAEYKIVLPEKPVHAVNSEALGNSSAKRIKKPYIFDSSAANTSGMDYNWNSGDDYRFVKKTVYDPCPAGFCVPINFAFTGFTSDGAQHEFPDINAQKVYANPSAGTPQAAKFTNNATKTSSSYTVLIPAAGERGHNGNQGDGSLGDFQTMQCGYYWTAESCPGYANYAVYNFFLSYLNNYGWNAAPRNKGGVSNSAKSVRPMLEQDETSMSATGENLKAWD